MDKAFRVDGSKIKQMPHRQGRQGHWGCWEHIPGNVWSAGDGISYIPPALQKYLYIAMGQLVGCIHSSCNVLSRTI